MLWNITSELKMQDVNNGHWKHPNELNRVRGWKLNKKIYKTIKNTSLYLNFMYLCMHLFYFLGPQLWGNYNKFPGFSWHVPKWKDILIHILSLPLCLKENLEPSGLVPNTVDGSRESFFTPENEAPSRDFPDVTAKRICEILICPFRLF